MKYESRNKQIVVAMQGILEPKRFIAKYIMKPYMPTLLKTPIEPKEKWGKEGFLSVLIASGPFTFGNDINYSAIKELLLKVKNEKPHLLVLMGPFIDEKHKIISEGNLEIKGVSLQYSDLFKLIMREISNTVKEMNIRVIIQPSLRDLHHPYPFPQPAFSYSEASVNFVSNPQLIVLNDVSILLSNIDTLNDMDSAMVLEPKMTPINDIIVKSLLEQQSVYPIFPPNDVPVEYKYVDQIKIEHIPDIIISPSIKPCCAKDLNKQSLFINPGSLSREANYGTYCYLTIGSSGSTPATSLGAISSNRVRVDILKL